MNSRLIALNGNAGAFVNVLATLPVSRIKVREDDAAAATGIQVQTPIDNFLTTNVYAAASEPVEIPSFTGMMGVGGPTLGFPAQGQSGAFNFRAADKILSARGQGAGATTIRVEEYER